MGSATCPGALEEGAPHPAPRGAAGSVGWEGARRQRPQRPPPLTSPEPTAALEHPAALSRSPGEPAGWVGGQRGGAPRPVPRPDPPSCILNGSSLEEAGPQGADPTPKASPEGQRSSVRPPSPGQPPALLGWPCPPSSGGEHLRVGPGTGGRAQAATAPGGGMWPRSCPPSLQTRELTMRDPTCLSWAPPYTHLPAVPRFTPAPPPLRLQLGCSSPGSPSCWGIPALLPAACPLQSRPPQATWYRPPGRGRGGDRVAGLAGGLPWHRARLLV